MSQIDDDQDDGTTPSSGLEVVGAALFVAASFPAACVAKALLYGTDLGSEGLGGTAALAADVAGWVGPWPALLISTAIAAIGTLLILGTLRTSPMRFVVGVGVSGLGLAAIASALTLGAGGALGDGSGGWLASALGSWAGVLLGLAVIGAAVWLTFIREPGAAADAEPPIDAEPGAALEAGPFDDASQDDELEAGLDEDEDSRLASMLAALRGTLSGLGTRVAGIPAALRRRREESPALGRTADRRKRVATKPRRQSEPQTLSAALVRDDVEGVSHDEAAALAPDDKTLEYMEDVWRRANTDQTQPAPIPPSPYPEDVRLKGEIPAGAQVFQSLGQEAPGETQRTPTPHPLTGSPAGIPGGPVARPLSVATSFEVELPEDIAPFDFEDAAATPAPLQDSSSEDPFGGAAPAQPLSGDDAAALSAAVLREGASMEAPSTLPPGVTPIAPDPVALATDSTEALSVGDLLAGEDALLGEGTVQAAQADLPVTVSLGDLALPPELAPPPPASWETTVDDRKAAEVEIAEVDRSGHWARRDGEEQTVDDEAEVAVADVGPEAEDVEVEAEEPAEEPKEPEEPEEDEAEAELEEEEDEEAELEEGEEEEEEEYEYVDEDGNPIDASELAEYETDEDEEEEEDEEEAEYEEVDGEEEDEDEEEAEDAEDEDESAEHDEDDPAFEADAADEYEEAEAGSGEPDVVLEPQAPPPGGSRDATRVLEAGRIVVREGRVAVSLLQRELEMEFDAACELLDQLQDEGLIGPYKGGKKRDILLSGEEWEGRFVRS